MTPTLLIKRDVSIPLRKVSRGDQRLTLTLLGKCFHPSKEGFKVYKNPFLKSYFLGFHPSKEGFKASRGPGIPVAAAGFHPSKEGFKAGCSASIPSAAQVSIPLRKVSRITASLHVSCAGKRFHPSKEGFKVGDPMWKVTRVQEFPSL